jgi:hypothetical protein
MLRLLLLLTAFSFASVFSPEGHKFLHEQRSSPGDLEMGGSLAGLAAGATRYVRYEDLFELPQETYKVNDDTNFRGTTEISGVPLAAVAAAFSEKADVIVAICNDGYRTNYPREYVAAHHPLLVLKIDGHRRDQWPPSAYGGSMAPYLISHPFFMPSFRVLSHDDEPQIPYGVTRIEFHSDEDVFGRIRPRGTWPVESQVSRGYIIARQDCFRCHNMGAVGGTMAGHSWLDLAKIADSDGERFRRIIHDPKSVNHDAKMPAHDNYDAATLDALTAYFRAFAKLGDRRAKDARTP